MEYRIKCTDLTIDERDGQKVAGYINVTERQSETLFDRKSGKWFKETIKQGAFQRALNEAMEIQNRDIPLLLEHNYEKELANTSDGSLALSEDQIGLRFEATIKNDGLLQEIRNRDIKSCSFGFIPKQQDIEEINPKLEKRCVEDLTLFEVSLVRNPAYVGSLVEERTMQEVLEEEETRAKAKEKEDKEKDTKEKEDKEGSEEKDTKEKDTKEKDTKEDSEEKTEDNKKDDKGKKDQKEESEEEETDEGKKKNEEKREYVEVPTESVEPKEEPINKEMIKDIIKEVISELNEKADGCEREAGFREEDQEYLESAARECEHDAIDLKTQAYIYRLKVLKLKQYQNTL